MARFNLVLTDLQTRQRVSDRMRIVYLQLPLFDKQTEAECMDIFDCWIYIVKNMRDIYATRKFDEKRGMAKEKIATAYRLLSMGLSEAQVATATELPLEEIQKMKE